MGFPASHVTFPLRVGWFSFEGNKYFGQGPPQQSGRFETTPLSLTTDWVKCIFGSVVHCYRTSIYSTVNVCVCISMLPPTIRPFATTQIHSRVMWGLLGAHITFSTLLFVNLWYCEVPFYIVSFKVSKTCFAARNQMFFVFHQWTWMSAKLIHCMYLDDIVTLSDLTRKSSSRGKNWPDFRDWEVFFK